MKLLGTAVKKFFQLKTDLFLTHLYRKLPLKNTGDTLKGPDGTVLVTAHWVLLAVAHDILYFQNNDS